MRSGKALVVGSLNILLFQRRSIRSESGDKWVNLNKYDIVDEFKRYQANQNFMMLPK